MKLYRVRLPGSSYHWFGTQADAKTGAKQVGGEYEQTDVPVDKPGLLSWLNNHTIIEGFPVDGGADNDEPHDFLAAAEERAVRASEADTRPMEADGHPVHRSAFTVAQVAASALPKSIVVQDTCHAIAKMRAGELGYVALEVMIRAAKLGGIPGVGVEREPQE